MWEIWAYELWPKALKCALKSNKSPDLVTLLGGHGGSRLGHRSMDGTSGYVKRLRIERS